MPKLSVVIPVYNSEKYLKRCIESVLNQTYEDLEIICVDDGSKDDSGKMLDKYAESDSRLVVVHQGNQGVSSARKTAISKASGEFITFVDSDDYIDLDYYSQLMPYVLGADIAMCGYYRNNNRVYMDLPVGKYSTKEEMEYFFSHMLMIDHNTYGVSGHLVSKIFRTLKLKDIIATLTQGLYYREDNDLIYRYLLNANSVNISSVCGYHYVDNPVSITHMVHPDFLENLSRFYVAMIETLSKHKYSDSLLEQFKTRTFYDIYDAPKYLGIEFKTVKYINPFISILKDKRYVIYGAGTIGKDYFRQMKAYGNLPVSWIDKSVKEPYQSFNISNLSELNKFEYDYIVIAINNEEIVKEVKKTLVDNGVDDSIILWQKAISIYQM